MENSLIISSACLEAAPLSSTARHLVYSGFLWLPRRRFSQTEKSGTSPLLCLSSGMCETPRAILLSVGAPVMSSPFRWTPPPVAFLSPVRASTSSVCPFPSTPEMPRISEACTSRLTPLRAGSPLSSVALRPSTLRTTSSPSEGCFSKVKTTLLPTIILASSETSVSLTLTVPTTLPRFRTVTLSQMDMTSLSLWEMNMTVLPCTFRDLTALKSSSTSWGVRTAVGSSRMSMSAPLYNAFSISTLCWTPTERVWTGVSGSTWSP